MRACLTLANFTGWSLATIDEMTCEELATWIDLFPKNNPMAEN